MDDPLLIRNIAEFIIEIKNTLVYINSSRDKVFLPAEYRALLDRIYSKAAKICDKSLLGHLLQLIASGATRVYLENKNNGRKILQALALQCLSLLQNSANYSALAQEIIFKSIFWENGGYFEDVNQWFSKKIKRDHPELDIYSEVLIEQLDRAVAAAPVLKETLIALRQASQEVITEKQIKQVSFWLKKFKTEPPLMQALLIRRFISFNSIEINEETALALFEIDKDILNNYKLTSSSDSYKSPAAGLILRLVACKDNDDYKKTILSLLANTFDSNCLDNQRVQAAFKKALGRKVFLNRLFTLVKATVVARKAKNRTVLDNTLTALSENGSYLSKELFEPVFEYYNNNSSEKNIEELGLFFAHLGGGNIKEVVNHIFKNCSSYHYQGFGNLSARLKKNWGVTLSRKIAEGIRSISDEEERIYYVQELLLRREGEYFYELDDEEQDRIINSIGTSDQEEGKNEYLRIKEEFIGLIDRARLNELKDKFKSAFSRKDTHLVKKLLSGLDEARAAQALQAVFNGYTKESSELSFVIDCLSLITPFSLRVKLRGIILKK
jgi:hypothetical protein